MSEQKYCISAKNRVTKVTEGICGAMSKDEADAWRPNNIIKKYYTYFRIAKFPFKAHKKGH